MPDCRIASIEVKALRFPLDPPISSSLGAYTGVDFTAVWMHTEAGPTGFGFNAGLGGHASAALVPYIQAELAPLAVGQDAMSPEALWERLWGVNKPRLRGGLGAWALSAIDIACWDVVAKVAGLPLHNLLGGYRVDVPVYGSGGWLSLEDEALVAEGQRFAAMGITAYKYKVGGARDQQRSDLLRRELGEDMRLFADANQKFTVDQAIETSSMLADYGVGWLEEPVLADDAEALVAVAERSAIPLAAGENIYYRWGFRDLCQRGAVGYVQPDVARCGGVTEFRRVSALADSYGVALSSHLWHELSISLVGAAPSGFMVEYAPLIPEYVLTRPFPVKAGVITVPDTAGHGVELTSEAVSRFSV